MNVDYLRVSFHNGYGTLIFFSACFPYSFNMKPKLLFQIFVFFILSTSFLNARVLYVDHEAGQGGNGSSWEFAFTNISDGILKASSGDEVWVASGIYREKVSVKSGVSLYGSFNKSEASVSERLFGDTLSVIDASAVRNGAPAFHAVIFDRVVNSCIDGFLIKGGAALGKADNSYGGGILALGIDESCTIKNCIIRENTAESRGAGIYLYNSSPYIKGCSILFNSARSENSHGGAVYCKGNASFENCVFAANIASYGGGISSRGNIQITGCTFSGNSARYGGAIFCHKTGVPRLKNCIIRDNPGTSVFYTETPPVIEFSCIDKPFSGTGNISSDPEFIAWDDLSEIFINSTNFNNADGSAAFPFTNFLSALELYDLRISNNSPCADSGEGGTFMGALKPFDKEPGINKMLFNVADGEYDTSKSSLAWNVSIHGESCNKTNLRFGLRGLRSGCEFRNLAIKSARYRGVEIAQDESPILETCYIKYNNGGGVFTGRNSGAVFRDCIIKGNFSARCGGGVLCEESQTVFTDCDILENKSGENGGGISFSNGSSPVLEKCTLSKNQAGHDGGGIYCGISSMANVNNCIIKENTAYTGGAIFFAPGSSSHITSSTLLKNTAALGGGIYSDEKSSSSFQNSMISANTAWYGAGYYGSQETSSRFFDCLFQGNQATLGAAAYSSGKDSFNKCTVRANAAMKSGGAFHFARGSSPEVINCSILVNSATRGGAIAAFNSSPLIKNSIIWGNSGESIFSFNSSMNISFSCVEGGFSGIGNISENPAFLAWKDNEIIYLDSSYSGISDGSLTKPYPDISTALDTFSLCLSMDSPCVASGEISVNMGASEQCGGIAGNTSVTLSLKPGDYQVENCMFSWYLNLIGSGRKKTRLIGTVAGLRSGSSLKNLTVTGGNRSGIRIPPHENPVIENCLIMSNMASGVNYHGGGVYCASFSAPHFKNCSIQDNFAVELSSCGGGIYCDEKSAPLFTDCVINKNSATVDGGGVFIKNATPQFIRCSITENSVEGFFPDGGGVFSYKSKPRFENCIISSNRAREDGGGFAFDFESEPLIKNCLITGNRAGKYGGGFYSNNEVFLKIENATISGNLAEKKGDALFSFRSDPDILNSIIRSDPNRIFHSIESILNISWSDISGSFFGTGNIDEDPLFISPGYWKETPGGKIWISGDYHLNTNENSPCIDAGNPDTDFNDACIPPGAGTYRNDMGCYGGPGNCESLPVTINHIINYILGMINPGPIMKNDLDINQDDIIDTADIIGIIR
jgi:parallel beta-helix repeat protein/predicted outer membrane repeat protein